MGTSLRIKLGDVKKIILLITIFFFLYDVRIVGYISTKKIAVIFALGYLVIHYDKTQDLLRQEGKVGYYFFLFVIISQMLMILVRGIGVPQTIDNDYLEVMDLLALVLYLIIFSMFAALAFDSADSFIKTYIVCTLIQCFIVWGVTIFEPIRDFVFNLAYSDCTGVMYNSMMLWQNRQFGLGVLASSGSVILASSLVFLIYLRRQCKIKEINFLIMYFFIEITTSLVGRTGALAGLICFFVYLIQESKIKNIKQIAIFIVLITIISSIFIQTVSLSERVINIIEWSSGFLDRAKRAMVFDTIRNMEVPRISWETLIGTNMRRGTTPSGIKADSDSGYVMMYFAMGLIGAIFYYFSFLVLFFSVTYHKKIRYKAFIWLVLAMCFVMEYKEPYMQGSIIPFALLTIIHFENERLMEDVKVTNKKTD